MPASSLHRDPYHSFSQSLEQMSDRGRRRRLVVQRTDGPYLVNGDQARMLNFGGNDYLGVVAGGPIDASLRPDHVETIPSGATASALVCGWTPHHQRLADSIARLEGTEAAVVFPSGYAACSGTVATLCRENDLILSDALNHASLIDGCRISPAQTIVYPHRDTDRVAELLKQHRDRFEKVWIVTDGVFSMDGTCAPLPELVRLARTHDAALIVDEAHGTGVLGHSGGGLCHAMQLSNEIPIRIGTLSKAIGHQGGFVAGPRVVIDYLIQFCRTLIYSTALSPQTAAGAGWVIDHMALWNDRRDHLASLARHLRSRIGAETSDRFATDLEAGVPIVPIIVGEDQRTVDLSLRLREQGFYVPAIRPPTVPEGTSRLRVSLSAAHSIEHVDALLDAYHHILADSDG